jgi:sugar-specific transcriptional regulator TrmB
MEKDILNALESIGLNQNEAIVYLDLIKAGESSDVEISRRTKIHRPNVYDCVAKLVKKGLTKQAVESDKKLFTAMDSSNLLNYVKQKEFELQKVMHLIEELKVNGSESETKIVSDLDVIERKFYELMNKGEIVVYGMPADLGRFRVMLDRFMKKCGNAEIKIRIIYSDPVGTNKLNSRVLPSRFDSKITTFISEDKVLLLFWNSANSCALIKDKYVAASYKEYFERLWENAKG